MIKMDRTRPEFEKKFAEIRNITRKHTVEGLTAYAGEYLKELETYLIQRNGIYEGKIVPKGPKGPKA